MIDNDTKWNINFSGSFLTDARFTNAYLWLKNADTFKFKSTPIRITWTQGGSIPTLPYVARQDYRTLEVTITPTVAGIIYDVFLYKNGIQYSKITKTSIVGLQSFFFGSLPADSIFTVYILPQPNITFNSTAIIRTYNYSGGLKSTVTWTKASNQTVIAVNASVSSYFPEIKIEEFLSGIMKMFNLTCHSTDGINYTLDTLENYYATGTTRDLTKYIKSDNININRVKSYKKINFEYEKSESVINTGFSQANGIEYGNLLLDTAKDGDEYNIKLPFEDLNFSNLNTTFQVGYSLKNDFNKYIPKPVILYDYNPTALTAAGFNYYLSPTSSGTGATFSSYKAFGQEYFDGTNTYSLNFPQQQSTLTNSLIDNSLYNQYYENYIGNVFNPKARLIKVSGILPTSLLTSLKLNDKILIRDKKYIINTMTTDLTTGEVQFELLTDFRVAI
jgi:hypothetical protein